MYIRTLEEFAAAVKTGITTESLTLDFKETIHFRLPKGSPDEVRQKTCRDIAQFGMGSLSRHGLVPTNAYPHIVGSSRS
jgi:hypothetical protein